MLGVTVMDDNNNNDPNEEQKKITIRESKLKENFLDVDAVLIITASIVNVDVLERKRKQQGLKCHGGRRNDYATRWKGKIKKKQAK